MPFPSLNFPEKLDNNTQQELESFVSLHQGHIAVEHLEDGSHGDIHARSLTMAADTTSGATGDVIVDGVGTFNGNVTADADGSPAILGSFGSGDAGLDASVPGSAASHWRVVAKSGLSPGRRLNFRDVLEVNRTVHFFFSDSSVGSGAVNYSFLPGDSTVGVNFGENTSGLRLGEANFSIVRSDNALYERRRTAGIGEFTSFTPSLSASAGTWSGATVNRATYRIIGKELRVEFDVANTNVSAAPADLILTIPGGFTAAGTVYQPIQVVNAGGTAAIGIARAVSAATEIRFQSTAAGGGWTLTAGNNTTVRGAIAFEVQ
jgi:hypothetical protein